MMKVVIAAVLIIGGFLGLGFYIKQHTNIEGTVVEKAFTAGHTSVGTAIGSDGNVHTVTSTTYDEYIIFIDGEKFNVSSKQYFKIDKGDYVKIRKGRIVEIRKGEK
ncbi:hypothetical protein Q9R38_26040 [Priestia aryabhattai]|uniref:hypothetical protein n=1 Tax=Priestia aryabhattai TaxID=412384 RepID=UPI0028814FAD|nr:hypothetical protein [Priestia aryabhattai]MDT0150005.1 hypothetical protein [Priestia aryabhattai]MDT0155575.1 hypothetical protein [Priestia aryabhattai]